MSPLRIACAAALAGAALALPASDVTANPARPTVTILLGSHFYQPNPIYLAGGVPVRLVFQNRAGKAHSFKAPEFFRASRLLSGQLPSGEIELKRGRGAVVHLIPARGQYRVHCTEPFHTMLGMTGRIIVS